MQLQTVIDIKEFSQKITPHTKTLLLGSCFSTNIGQRMAENKFFATTNPTGTLYNPASICRAIELMESGKIVTLSDLEFCDGLYYSFDFHSSFSSVDPLDAIAKMNRALDMGRKALESCDVIILTWGSAWAYNLKDGGQAVANCHREAGSKFNRMLLSVDEITNMVSVITQRGPYCNKQIILTVSPIRHLGDGAAENMLSKAHLIAASHAIVANNNNVSYFPSFEIMIDELRDYRFYQEDMTHPSKVAIDYIWERFMQAGLNQEAANMVKDLQRIKLALGHRPFNKNAPSYKKFVENTLKQISQLKEKYPTISLTEEVNFISE